MDKQVKIALPKGRLLAETAAWLKGAGWGLSAYHKGMPSYRPRSQKFPELLAKVFHEKDIPIQVAVGNYDLGICGLDWVDELLVKYPSSALGKLRNLGYGQGSLFAAVSRSGAFSGRYTIVVDDDVNPYDLEDVIWAVATRSLPNFLSLSPSFTMSGWSRAMRMASG